MSGIRVTYSGLIGLLVRLISVVTGAIFIIIVTRNLTPEEFGLWKLIGGLIAYVMIVDPIINYWLTRQIAREEEVARTGFAVNGLFSIGISAAYLLMIYFVAPATNSSYDILLISTILVPVNFLANTLDSINLGFKPQMIWYAVLAFELAKIPFALLLVEVGDMGLVGAIYATFIAHIVRNAVSFYTAKAKMREKLNFKLVKNWIKLAWLPLYVNGPGLILFLDVLVFALIVGSVEPLSYYAAATTISVAVVYASTIAYSLYPKLVADQKKEHVEQAIKRLFSFGIPLLAGTLIFAKPGLFVLNPVYVIAEPVVYITAVASFAYAVWAALAYMLTGIERVDANMNARFSDYTKSKLFLVPSLSFVQFGAYTGGLALMLLATRSLSLSVIDLIILWAMIRLVTQVPFTFHFWRLAVRHVGISFPGKNVARYSLAAIVAALLTYLLNSFILVYDSSLFSFIPRLVAALSFGAAIYFSIAYSTDHDFKSMTQSIIRELASIRK